MAQVPKHFMQPSPYQINIIKAVQQRLKAKKKKGLIVEALAGAGKSTILWMIAQELRQHGFQASEVVALVFGKKNQLDLQTKFKTKVGQEWGESVRTIHSLCYEIYRTALSVPHSRVKVERSKYKEIAQKFGLLPLEDEYQSTPGSLLQDELIFAEKDFLDLLEKLRLYCLDATTDNVAFLTNLYKLGIKGIPQVTKAAAKCLKQGLAEATGKQYRIDTCDMVWVVWALRADARFAGAIKQKQQQLRVVALDEAQDTDLLQIEVLSLLIDPERSFLLGVGDAKQAVYFFRGCLNDGLERITQRFNAENLPLPLCYRCGVKHLELIREIFPTIPIQPRPNAPQGEIKVIWEKDFLSIFDNSALQYMGVCRKNAPLTIAAIQLLAAGKPAKIKDKNIGGRLVSRVREVCQGQRYKPDTFPEVLRKYESAQRRKLQKFPDGEAKISDLEDTLQAIWALFEHYEPKTLKAWEEVVNRIFDESGYSPISLYSIHSGKGGEGQVSFILSPDELPLEHPKQVQQEREQEQHLLYVALSRTLADGAERLIKAGGNLPPTTSSSGVLYLIIREDQDGKPKYPAWLPKKYRLLKETKSPKTREKCLDTAPVHDDLEETEESFDLRQLQSGLVADEDINLTKSSQAPALQAGVPMTPKAQEKRLGTPTSEAVVSEAKTKEKCLDTPQRLSVVVKVPQVKGYERVVTAREITFTCQRCDQTVTQERMPGPLPSYCSDRCRLDAAATRKRASRAITGKNKGKRGRPRKETKRD